MKYELLNTRIKNTLTIYIFSTLLYLAFALIVTPKATEAQCLLYILVIILIIATAKIAEQTVKSGFSVKNYLSYLLGYAMFVIPILVSNLK